MSQIKITPEELREAATFIDSKRDELCGVVAEIKSKIDEVTSNWEGAAQASFIESFESDMYPLLKENMPEVLEGVSTQMNSAADALEEADESVANAFRG